MSLKETFDSLSEKWKRDTVNVSSIPQIIRHPAYQEIIKMGHAVVPLILADLRESKRAWFVALHVITGANPIPVEHIGVVDEMIKDWLDYGQKNGFLIPG